MPALSDVIDAMIASGFCDEAGLVGCSDDDLDDLELRASLALPTTYREFMRVAGRTRPAPGFRGELFSLHVDDVGAAAGPWLIVARQLDRAWRLRCPALGQHADDGDVVVDGEGGAADVCSFLIALFTTPRVVNAVVAALTIALPRLVILDEQEAIDVVLARFADPPWSPLLQRWDDHWCRLVAMNDDGFLIVAVATHCWIVTPPSSTSTSGSSGRCAIEHVRAPWREVVVAVTNNAIDRATAGR